MAVLGNQGSETIDENRNWACDPRVFPNFAFLIYLIIPRQVTCHLIKIDS